MSAKQLHAHATANGVPACDQPGCYNIVWCWEHEEAFIKQMMDANPPAVHIRFKATVPSKRFQAIGRDLLESEP